MKSIQLLILSVGSLVFGRTFGQSTANAVPADKAADPAADIADLQTQFTALQEQSSAQALQIETLTKQLAAANVPKPPPQQESGLALIAKGAGIPLKDLQWRVQAGLSQEQAVQAVRAQANYDKAKAAREKLTAAQAKSTK